ncbi:glycosyltransferase [Acidiphilium sp. PA]|uniref:glycosyltransferase family 2 protein n=1 Tax=Acidiphilium sp. PA TaxID=2871705 RepID=UPI002242C857|nr:glycosyltransferase family 2 protein [Acidiphilium sp. PA]MCW8309001.1 glycosyltransferase [Acidiphilium sp. PA]
MNLFNGVSVVLPAYNRAELIPETLDRIFAQTIQAAEIIVVDDGSTDATKAVLAGYADRIRAIHIPNAGELVARNTGLRAAKGDLVAFCDSDDLWKSDHLAEMAQFWSSGQGPIAAYADFQEVRDGQWAATSKFASAPAGYWNDVTPVDSTHVLFDRPIVKDLLQFQPFFPSCMVVDRERFLALGGWDEGVSRMVGCDFATTLRIAEHPPIGVLRQPTVGIRKHAGNFSGDVQRMNLGDADVLEYVLASRPSLASSAAEIRHSINHRRLAAFDTAFARGDFNAVGAISQKLPSTALTPRHRVKAMISDLPAPIRRLAWSILTRNN